MPINMTKSLTSVGVGVVDEVLEYWDARAAVPRTESFRTWKDIGRLVMAGTGYALQAFMPRYSDLGETLAISATPLLVKSIAKPLKTAMKITGRPYSTPMLRTPSQAWRSVPVEDRLVVG